MNQSPLSSRKFEHLQIVRVSDPNSPHHGQRAQIYVAAFDTIVERNPDRHITYVCDLIDTNDRAGKIFAEWQLSPVAA